MAEENDSDQVPPIIYYEDPSYTRISSERGRALARRWRYMLERTHGLYNALLNHACTDECFQSKSGQEGFIEVIASDEGLYGCTRSGVIHVCHTDIFVRRSECRNLIRVDDGSYVCRFSGKLLYEPENEAYNPYTDDNVHVFSTRDRRETKEDKDQKAVFGLGKMTERESSERKNDQSLRSKTERQLDSAQARNLGEFMKRHGAPSSESEVVVVKSPAKKKNVKSSGGEIKLAGGFHVPKAHFKVVKSLIHSILCNKAAREWYGHATAALDPGNKREDAILLDYYVRRVCLTLALAQSSKKVTNVRSFALTCLYVFARGIMLDTDNFIAPDLQLKERLPPEDHLVIYGIPEKDLLGVMGNPTYRVGDEKEVSQLKPKMASDGLAAIQALIREPPRGMSPSRLRELLNTSLVISVDTQDEAFDTMMLVDED